MPQCKRRVSATEIYVAAIILDEIGLIDLDHPLRAETALYVARRVVDLQNHSEETRKAEFHRRLSDLSTALPGQVRFLENLASGSVRFPVLG